MNARTDSSQRLTCFKAYDVRGRVPEELDEALAYRIGRAFAHRLGPQKVVIGRDVRLSSPAIEGALIDGLAEAGVEVLDLGLCGTEEIYFATFSMGVDGGLVVTASHNPPEYNGIKFVRQGARPISADSGLKEIEALAASDLFESLPAGRGSVRSVDNRDAYVDHLLGYVDPAGLAPLKIVVNAGNGCAGPVLDLLARQLPFSFIRINHEPDGRFPHGVPNPLLPEQRAPTSLAVQEHRADLGLAWDGDFDRCFVFDEKGRVIEGYYMVGFLAQAMLVRFPGARIVHDPRLVWNTRELVAAAGGVPVLSKAGHSFMKECMRAEDAVYGGEMSAHHYFREFSYCDSGMIPWLLLAQIVSRAGKPLSALVGDRMRTYPVSGEINSVVADPARALGRIEERLGAGAVQLDRIDGLSMEFDGWRFNVRKSNTEPVVRLNVETRANRTLLEEKTKELLHLIREE